MNKLTKNKTIIYILLILFLFSIPIYTIIANTDTLKDGTEFLFKVEAFDPYDMFRGNYLNISFEEDSVSGDILEQDINNKEVFVTIAQNSDGFAFFKDISLTKPIDTSAYYKTTCLYKSYTGKYIIDTPTRYYMNENKSSLAEQLYMENIDSTYIKVRVKNGKMVIVGVYINDVLIDSL